MYWVAGQILIRITDQQNRVVENSDDSLIVTTVVHARNTLHTKHQVFLIDNYLGLKQFPSGGEQHRK